MNRFHRNFASARAPQVLFDLHTKSLQKARASINPEASSYDYLRDHIADSLVDRLADISRSFPNALDLFCGSAAHILRALERSSNKSDVQQLHHADIHPLILDRTSTFFTNNPIQTQTHLITESNPIPSLPPFDLIISGGSLHWVNDLRHLVATACAALKPDGVFLAAMCGGDTLHELRVSMQLAETELFNRVAPRISPMVRLQDAAHLLGAAGLAMPTADVEKIIIPYKDMKVLLKHLRGMGETNCLVRREPHFGKATFERAEEIYWERFAITDPQGRKVLPATFEIMHMIGWKPAPKQPRAAPRGSAQFSIKDLPSTTGNKD